VLVYCDTNVYCRPFDDQSQQRIRAETGAFLGILERVDSGEITLVSSDILEAEVNRISEVQKRRLVRLYLNYCDERVPMRMQIAARAQELVGQCGLKSRDALHVASACQGEARWFLTCDDRLANKREAVRRMTGGFGFAVEMLNPVAFLADLDVS
jgi:predicted nucleic acid-binding protein